MLGGHWYDLLPLLLIALLVFGTKRLPEMGSSVGKTIKEFQRSMREINEPAAPTTVQELPTATTAAPAQIPAVPATPVATPTTVTETIAE